MSLVEPLIITPKVTGDARRGALVRHLVRERGALAMEKRRRGALIFRDFDVGDPRDFQSLLEAWGAELLPCDESFSRRVEVLPRIYPTTTASAVERVCMHNELCRFAAPPRELFLFCCQPPASGGRTPLLDGRDLLDRMGAAGDALRRRRIRYVTNMCDVAATALLGRSWQAVYGTQDRDAVEDLLDAHGIDFAWQPNGGLRVWREGPVTAPHPETGEEVWFNQAPLWHVTNLGRRGRLLRGMLGEEGVPSNATFADGSPIPDAVINAARQVMWDESLRFDWRAGDMAIVDNYRLSHGREPFKGERRVLLALGA